METNGKITVIGSANVDLIMKVRRLPRPAETITGGEFLHFHGGKGANQAVAAARAGGNVSFIGCLGDDAYAPQIIENLRSAGIETGGVSHASGIPTGTALIFVNETGENMIAVAPGANAHLSPDHILAGRARIESSSLIMLQMEIPSVTIQAVLELAERLGVPVMLNYAPAAETAVPVGKAISLLVVNELEAEALTGRPVNDRKAAFGAGAELLRRGPRTVIVTLGADGATLTGEGDEQHVPAFPVKAVDATAAGDTFCGALAVARVEGQDLLSSVRFASAAAALSATRIGAQPSIPTRPEIDGFLAARN
jgi:ribokinase